MKREDETPGYWENISNQMQRHYEQITAGLETAENPALKGEWEKREVLVLCECKEQYLVWLNGNTPIPDYRDLSIVCPHCQRSMEEARSRSGHSAGVFNLSIGKNI